MFNFRDKVRVVVPLEPWTLERFGNQYMIEERTKIGYIIGIQYLPKNTSSFNSLEDFVFDKDQPVNYLVISTDSCSWFNEDQLEKAENEN